MKLVNKIWIFVFLLSQIMLIVGAYIKINNYILYSRNMLMIIGVVLNVASITGMLISNWTNIKRFLS